MRRCWPTPGRSATRHRPTTGTSCRPTRSARGSGSPTTTWPASRPGPTAHGLTVVATSPQRTTVSVVAPARTVEAVFDVTLRDYADGRGRTFHAPADEPRVPAALDGLVAAVDGLDARPSERPASRPDRRRARRRDDPGDHRSRLRARGTPLARPPRRGPDRRDRLARHVRPGRRRRLRPAGRDVRPAGRADRGQRRRRHAGRRPGRGQPRHRRHPRGRPEGPDPRLRGAQQGRRDRGGHRPDRPDGRADIVSISWGSCEANRTTESMARMASSMAAAAAAGITVFVASGDHGAYDCIDNDRTDLRISVDSPASDVNVDRRRRDVPDRCSRTGRTSTRSPGRSR